MKDLIAKLTMDANCAMGAIWLHIDAQAARIAELEAQIAAKADIDKLREALKALGELADLAQQCDSWQSFPAPALEKANAVIAKLSSSTALQAPVQQVPEGYCYYCSEGYAHSCPKHKAAAPLPAAPVQTEGGQ